MAVCPYCNAFMNGVRMTPMPGESKLTRWNCVAYCCPTCDRVISVDLDSSAVRADIVDHIQILAKKLGVSVP